MKKNILVIGLAMTMVCSLAGCGKENTDTTSETDATTENVGSEDVASDTEAEEVVEEDNTWFGKNNITFTEGEVTVPYYGYVENDDGSVDENVTVTQQNASYSEPILDISTPDENGNITYTVQYDVTFPYSCLLPNSYESINYRYITKNYYFVDAYTGTVFPEADLTSDNEQASAIELDIEVDGKTYHISTYSSMNKGDDQNAVFTESGADKLKYSCDITEHMTLTAVVPADYNGLILALDGNGVTEYEELDTEITEAHPFEDDVETTIFKDVSYGVNLVDAECKSWIYTDDSENDLLDSIIVDYGSARIYFDGTLDENEVKTEGFITVNWKDGTSTIVQSENIEYYVYPVDETEQRAYETSAIFFTLDSFYDAAQVESVVVGNNVYSAGIISR
ncbi:MAG: hypothetical protein ACI4GW_01650 [Lachnospiraceae bacterium]